MHIQMKEEVHVVGTYPQEVNLFATAASYSYSYSFEALKSKTLSLLDELLERADKCI